MEVFKIKHRYTKEILFQGEFESFQDCVKDARTHKIDLRYSDFSYCNFYRSNFSFINFTGCDFRCGDFKYINFTGCDFTGCDFTGCEFNYCNFNHGTFKSTIITDAGDVINEIPTQITGLKWTVTIFDHHMQIGCELHKISDWEVFSDERIGVMDSQALNFCKKNKQFLLSACAANGRK